MQLKDLLSREFIAEVGEHFRSVQPGFDTEAFHQQIFHASWPTLELKQRIRHVASTLHGFLPAGFPEAAQMLVLLSRRVRRQAGPVNFGYMFLPDYVEQYGLEDFDTSVAAMEEITQLMSAEFAVRPFLLRYPDAMLARMLAWSKHENRHLRRLSSEGCRPRLPWGMGIPFLKADPSPILPILENLRSDPSEEVRRSVANNLNDISKDHPQLVLDIARRWLGQSPETDAIVKHACRSLLKKGLPQAIELFGYHSTQEVHLDNLRVSPNPLYFGNYLHFEFELLNNSPEPKVLRLEYGVYFRKSTGSLSRKVFKISEQEYPGHSTTVIRRKQHFKPITTRRYYPGRHELSIIVNGEERLKGEFELIIGC